MRARRALESGRILTGSAVLALLAQASLAEAAVSAGDWVIEGPEHRSSAIALVIESDDADPQDIQIRPGDGNTVQLVAPEDAMPIQPGHRHSLRLGLQSPEPTALLDLTPLRFEVQVGEAVFPFSRRARQHHRCVAAPDDTMIDGDLGEWGPLLKSIPFAAETAVGFGREHWSGDADCHARFTLAADDRFFYLALHVQDNHVDAIVDEAPWFQDGFELRIDARRQPLMPNTPMREGRDILLIAGSPVGEGLELWKSEELPAGTLAASTAVPAGWVAEVAIPISWFNEQQGDQAWTHCRLNLAIDDSDPVAEGDQQQANEEGRSQIWWRPDWRKDNQSEVGIVVAPEPPMVLAPQAP